MQRNAKVPQNQDYLKILKFVCYAQRAIPSPGDGKAAANEGSELENRIGTSLGVTSFVANYGITDDDIEKNN
ncbi:MAG: hypothetical protein IH823_03710, partial [Candidatus Dadabacteria bacterium]|nr:hypothetical protein [Candidatus Dadabacteria bacterium]